MLATYGGMLIGALYGLFIRYVFGLNSKFVFDFADLFSITFVWVLPIIMGLIPLLLATKAQLENWTFRMLAPALTVIFFLGFCLVTRLEDFICIFIIGIPYFLMAAVVGLLFGKWLLAYKSKRSLFLSVVFLPFVLAWVENTIPAPSAAFEVNTPIIIHAPAAIVWQNIVRVREIQASEYQKGLYNYAGIPRPIYAEFDNDTLGATRIGHFEGGLQFKEKVVVWKRNHEVAFSIQLIPGSVRNAIFDQHVLKGNHFRFLQAAYQLKSIDATTTELRLLTNYQLHTSINAYGSFWGQRLMTDFQTRLLQVIKARCEQRRGM